MSSGLRFIAGQDPDYTPDKGYPDHTLIYTGAIDAFKHSMTRPLQFPPNTEGRYRNSDPLMIGWLIKQAVTKRGEDYLTYPQRALFDRIGIRRQVLETDPYGNFLLSGYDYGTARNWARIGLLYLQDGMWQGQRLLPEGWATFVSTPAPAWKQPIYGGLFWVNGDGAWNVPKTAYFAERRRRPADVHHPDSRSRRRAHGSLPRRPGRDADAQRGAEGAHARGRHGTRIWQSGNPVIW